MAEKNLSSGEHAFQLIRHQYQRLVHLQLEVLADTDPEPLHQFRVSLRRLRTALSQFAPALQLPEGVSSGRIAGLARRTGLSRDLDVLRQRLEEEILPRLPVEEARALRPALKRLRRERDQAFEGVVEALQSGRYLKLLARLSRWQTQPVFTPLGHQPLRAWLQEWQQPLSTALFLEPGWYADSPDDGELHELRKRIKGVRYALEHLEEAMDPDGRAWIAILKRAQTILGDLHDWQVLEESLLERPGHRHGQELVALRAGIEADRATRWQQWQQLAAQMLSEQSRRSLPALTEPPFELPADPSA
jgi:CHAD domain-containing protein